jgi:hypothetical protein
MDDFLKSNWPRIYEQSSAFNMSQEVVKAQAASNTAAVASSVKWRYDSQHPVQRKFA